MVASSVVAPEELEPFKLVSGLPPLPDPDLRTMRMEATVGCVCTLSVIVGCVGATHVGRFLLEGVVSEAILNTALRLVYTEAVVALVCLAGLLFGDPGVIHRSERACFPLPAEVAEALQAGESLANLSTNIKEGSRTYCVRCLVWRDEDALERPSGIRERLCNIPGFFSKGSFHHCRTCQRCVSHFDHHCGYFGRCIAGRGLGGNMGYFKVILVMGNLGGCTAGVTMLFGMFQTKWGYWIALAALGYCAVVTVFSGVFLMMRCGYDYMSPMLEKWSRPRPGPPSHGGSHGLELPHLGNIIGAKGRP